MKTIIMTCSLFLMIAGAFAQQIITNGNFESWVNKGVYSVPSSWSSNDSEYSIQSSVLSVTKETDAKSGNFAAKVKVASNVGLGYAGFLGLGNAVNFGGILYNSRPTLFTGWTKYHTVGKDSVAIAAIFSKFNPSSGQLDNIGEAFIEFAGTQNNYSQFSVPITWLSSQTPDTLQLLIVVGDLTASNPVGSGGSYVIVDDFKLSYPTGLNENLLSNSIKIFPNPAKSIVEIELPSEMFGAKIQLTDLAGKTVYSGIETKLNLTDFVSGMYLVYVSKDEYSVTKKFIIE